MRKAILTIGDIQIEIKRCRYWESISLTRFPLVKETINTLLVTCIMIIAS